MVTSGPFQLPVLLRGTLYQIISVMQHRVLTVSEGNYSKRNYLRGIKHTKCSRDVLCFCAI